MVTPKALVCLLEDNAPGNGPLLTQLQTAGFSTAVISWKELDSRRSGLAEMAPLLDDEAVLAWILSGPSEVFTPHLRSGISLLSLALNRKNHPRTALVYSGEEPRFSIPDTMPHMMLYKTGEAVAAKLMAARLKPAPRPDMPFYLKAHLDPLVGHWLECGPHQGSSWEGFMLGLLFEESLRKPELTAFGVGPRGTMPRKSSLEYPLKGIEGIYGTYGFTACAARNLVTHSFSVFLRLEEFPSGVLLGGYPDDEKQEEQGERILFL